MRRYAINPDTRGARTRCGLLSAYRSQHKTRGEVARMEVPVNGVLVHCRWTRHLMNAKVERRQDECGEETSVIQIFGTADSRGMG
jgi:hypothetical protein